MQGSNKWDCLHLTHAEAVGDVRSRTYRKAGARSTSGRTDGQRGVASGTCSTHDTVFHLPHCFCGLGQLPAHPAEACSPRPRLFNCTIAQLPPSLLSHRVLEVADECEGRRRRNGSERRVLCCLSGASFAAPFAWNQDEDVRAGDTALRGVSSAFAPERNPHGVSLGVRYWIGTKSSHHSVSGAVCNAWAMATAGRGAPRGEGMWVRGQLGHSAVWSCSVWALRAHEGRGRRLRGECAAIRTQTDQRLGSRQRSKGRRYNTPLHAIHECNATRRPRPRQC